MTLPPKKKGVLGDKTMFGPMHDADRFRKWSWIKILGGYQSWIGQACQGNFGRTQTACVPRYRNSGGHKFYLEKSVPDVASASRSKVKSPPTRGPESSSLPIKLLPKLFTDKVRSSVPDQGIQYPRVNLAGEIN